MRSFIQSVFFGLLLFGLGCSSTESTSQEESRENTPSEPGEFINSLTFKMVLDKQNNN